MSNQKLQAADLLLVNRGVQSYKTTYGDFEGNIRDSHIIQDEFEPNLNTYPDLVPGTIWINIGNDPPTINIWNGSSWEELETKPPVVDPDPSTDVTIDPPVSGSGTISDPYILTPVTSYSIGGTVYTNETITLLNQPESTTFGVQTISGGVRFTQNAQITDANGEWTGRFRYIDTPESTVGQTYPAELKIGASSVYFEWEVVQVANQTSILGGDDTTAAPNAYPATVDYEADLKFGTGTGTWADGSSILTATGMILFGVNGGAIDATDKPITDGDTITVQFDEAQVAVVTEGDEMEGVLDNGNGFYYKWSVVKGKTPDIFTIDTLLDQGLNTAVNTGNEALTGINAPTQVALGSATLTDVEVSVNGGAYAVLPQTINPGDTLQAKGTTGGVNSETYDATFTVNSTVSATWEVETTDIAPTISQPQITSPLDGADNLTPDITLVSDAYQPQNDPGPHTSSTWEVYEADLEFVETSTIVSVESRGPTADMHGLRHDDARKTALTYNVKGTISKGTFSGWFKYTRIGGGSSYNVLATPDSSSNDYFALLINGKVYMSNGKGGGITVMPNKVNEWTHLVVQKDGTTGKVFLNGHEQEETITGLQDPIDPKEFIIGHIENIASGGGYVSDHYFVQDQILEPEVFGKSFNGVWGPLDSVEVKANINNSVQAPKAPNTEKKWSDFGDGKAADGGGYPEIFDGDVGTTMIARLGTTYDWVSDEVIEGPVRIYGKAHRGDGSAKVYIDNGDGAGLVDYTEAFNIPDDNAGSLDWVDCGTNLKAWQMVGGTNSNNVPQFRVVEVAGRTLVDGPANTSQRWSDHFTCADDFYYGNDETKAFDGNPNTRSSSGAISTANQTPMVLDLSANPIKNVTSISAMCQGILLVNGLEQGRSPSTEAEVSATFDPAISISSISFKPASSATGASVPYMSVNGQLLLDGPPAWSTDQVWSETIPFITGPGGTLVSGSNAFDGNTQTTCYTQGADIASKALTVDFTGQDLSGEVRIVTYTGRADGTGVTIQLNDGLVIDSGDYSQGQGGYRWIPLGSADPVETIKLKVRNNLDSAYVAAIEVGGVLLVNPGGFGKNGFYLPFDPANEGRPSQVYSSNPYGTFSGPNTADKAFDGNPATLMGADAAPAGVIFDYPLSGNLEVLAENLAVIANGSGKVRIYDSSDNLIAERGILFTSNNPGTIKFGDVTDVKKLEVHGGPNVDGSQGAAVSQVFLDGVLLIDGEGGYGSIGVDASGQNNNFTDKNFNSKVSVPTGELQSQDFSDNYLTGDVQGAEWQRTIEKFYGGAADFTSLTDPQAIQLPDTDAFVVGSGDFTISAWQYLPNLSHTAGENAYMFDVGTNSSNSRLSILRKNTGSYEASVGGQVVSDIIVASDLTANQWQYVTFVRTGGQMHAYVDGVLKRSKACTGSIANRPPADNEPAIGHTKIKSLNKVFNWKGYLQDFTIHKKALYTSNFTPPDYSLVDLETGDLDSRVDQDTLALAVPLNDYEYNPEFYTSGTDTVFDTPIKNYAVLASDSNTVALGNGNLDGEGSITTANSYSTIGTSSSFYFETRAGGADDIIGLSQGVPGVGKFPGQDTTSIGIQGGGTGIYYNSNKTPYDFDLEANDIIGVAYNGNTNEVTWYKNGVAGATVDSNLSGVVHACVRPFGDTQSTNFGQQPFEYDPPAGFESLYESAPAVVVVEFATDDNLDLMSAGDAMEGSTSANNANSTDVDINGKTMTFGTDGKGFEVGETLMDTSIDPIAPGKPSDPIDTGVYTQVVNEVDDTVNLTSYTLSDPPLQEGKAYYSRVQYKDDTTVQSEFSPYNEFITDEVFVPEIGLDYKGGYYAGQIETNGVLYNLIVAPISSGSLYGQSPTKLQWKTVASGAHDTATSEADGYKGSKELANNPDYPVFAWLNDANGPNAGVYDDTGASNGTGIGGYNDWYIPGNKELNVIYYYLKPTATDNNTAVTANGYAVDPQPTTPFATNVPGQTSIAQFQSGGSEAFLTDDWYWCADRPRNNDSLAHRFYFENGAFDGNTQTVTYYARAIRREPA